jgi:uncharacterized C2H2 Zn-finger protein
MEQINQIIASQKAEGEEGQQLPDGGDGVMACPRCDSKFNHAWKFTRHLKQCRSDQSTRVIVKKEDGYKCDICLTPVKDLKAFKNHVFKLHDEIQV